AERGIGTACGSYEELVSSPDVDVVYIASPHSAHAEHALLAIAAGKHVLVEKPLAATAAEARAIADAARAAGVFAMEAMWTRYLPQADVIRQLLDRGAIGEVRTLAADFGLPAPFDPSGRLFNPDLAGGALLDSGVYPISFASSVLGAPTLAAATGRTAETGVDTDAQLLLDHGTATSVVATSITASLPVRAAIMGTEGRIEVHPPFITATGVSLITGNLWKGNLSESTWTDRTFTHPNAPLCYQADALARYVADGRTESPLHTLEETIAIIDVIDDATDRIRTAQGIGSLASN
ncbi:MAG: Gfo/Idh/MocA family oxidoreductase, partial [Streptomyces sp.]|nr:Gfo/Idh/MocA family oxidoreductase [Streptomyces sp.]